MPLKVSVGFSQKLGQPDFGSIGATCQIECEIDGNLHDLEEFQRQVQDAYLACGQAVSDELNRHQPRSGTNGQNPATNGTPPSVTGNSTSNGNGTGGMKTNGNGHQSNGSPNGPSRGVRRYATQSQVRAIYAIARRERIELPQFLQERFQIARPDDLSITDASSLIDELKGTTQGDRR